MAESFVLTLFLLCPCLGAFGMWLFFVKYQLHRTPRHRGVLLLAGNGLVFLTLLSLPLPMGEIYFRWFYDTTDSFSLTKTTQRWFERHYRKNDAGVRDSVERYTLEKLSDRRRLVILGDSFTAAQGVADVERRFANRMRTLLPDWEIRVHARGGWDTPDELEEVTQMARSGYQADAVLLVYCLNDIAAVIPEWQPILKSIYAKDKDGFWVAHSYLLNTIYYRLYASSHPQVGNYFEFVLDAYAGLPWLKERELLEQIQEVVANQMHAKFLVATFPFLNSLEKYYRFQPAHDRLDGYWKARGIPHLDLLSVFAASRSADVMVNRFDAHPNERAHEMAAEAIAKFVRANL